MSNPFIVSLLALLIVDMSAQPSLVSDSPLQGLKGFSSAFSSDRSLQQHPAVIFAADFESPDFADAWDEKRDRDGDVLSLVAIDDTKYEFGRSLKVKATLGRNTGGGLTKWFQSTERLFVRFYTRFDEQCDYVHHFVTLRANKSLKGKDRWSGFGGAGLKPDGTERFSTALEPWGNWGRYAAPGKWNFYSYWHEMKASPDAKYWGNSFRRKDEGQALIRKNRWICLEFMLKHNTPNQPDGEQAFWVDGQLIGHWTGFNWRTHPTLKANALTLESYVTDRWTKQKENIVYFDNLLIAREYAGPLSTLDTTK